MAEENTTSILDVLGDKSTVKKIKSRIIKKDRTLALAKTTLEKAKKSGKSKEIISQLEKTIEALEALSNGISDEELLQPNEVTQNTDSSNAEDVSKKNTEDNKSEDESEAEDEEDESEDDKDEEDESEDDADEDEEDESEGKKSNDAGADSKNKSDDESEAKADEEDEAEEAETDNEKKVNDDKADKEAEAENKDTEDENTENEFDDAENETEKEVEDESEDDADEDEENEFKDWQQQSGKNEESHQRSKLKVDFDNSLLRAGILKVLSSQGLSKLESLDRYSLTESTKTIASISDDEFNILINNVLDAAQLAGEKNITITSDDQRKLQAKEIETDLASKETQQELSSEDVAQIRSENTVIKAREQENNKYKARAANSFAGFQAFLSSLYRAIALQVHTNDVNDDTWSAINRRYSGTGVLRQGLRKTELPDSKIPIIDFYFDCSGSWGAKDIEVGKQAVSTLVEMEEKGQIKINIYYFADHVFTEPEAARAEGGTGAWNEIVKNVISTKANNVIIMTDSDMEGWWVGDKEALKYTVPGCVWYLWRDGWNAPRLPRDLKGRGGTLQFSFNRQ